MSSALFAFAGMLRPTVPLAKAGRGACVESGTPLTTTSQFEDEEFIQEKTRIPIT